jgi:hypothetical protein
MDIRLGVRDLPPPLEGQAYFTGGRNDSDDLFLFIRRRIAGLQPGARYRASFCVTGATNLQAGGFGQALYVKAGVSTVEPQRVAVSNVPGFSPSPYYLMNVDKGTASQGGANALLLGMLAVPASEPPGYGLVTLASEQSLTVQADGTGAVWAFAGADSVFEAWAEAYWAEVAVLLEAVRP